MCPAHPEFEAGTWIIDIYCYRSGIFSIGYGCDFDLVLNVLPLPAAYSPPPTTCVIEPELNGTHECIHDDAPIEIDNPTAWDAWMMWFKFMVPPPPAGETTRRLYIESNMVLYVSQTEQFPIKPTDPEYNSAYPATYPYIIFQSPIVSRMHDVFAVEFNSSQTGPIPIYIAASTLSEGPGIAYIYLSTSLDYAYPKRLSAMNPFELAMQLQESSTLTCQSRQGNHQRFHCSRRISNIENEDCFFYWPMIPSLDPNPFWPRPTSTIRNTKWQDISWLQYISNESDAGLALDNHYQVALMLSYQANTGDPQIFPPGGIGAGDMESCEMHFYSNLVNDQGVPFNPKIRFTLETSNSPAAQRAKQFDSLVAVTGQMKTYAEVVESLSGRELVDTQFQLDVLAASRAFSASVSLASSLYLRTERETIVTTTECINRDNTDSCCNTSLAWSGRPCVPREQTQIVSVFSSTEDNLEASCPTDSPCTQTFIREFSNAQLSQDLHSCARGAPDEGFLTRTSMHVPRHALLPNRSF